MLGWKWDNGMSVMLNPYELDVSLQLENSNDTSKYKIQKMGSNDVKMGLGFRMAPSETKKNKISFRKSQSDIIEVQLGSSHLNPTEAWVFYSAVYNAKVFFPCKITSFS